MKQIILVCGLNKIQSLLVNNCILFLPVSLMVANIRYYLAAKDTTRAGIDADTYAMFISHDSIKTMKNNPALFAFKTAEEGGYYLENQKELNENGKPYVGVVNGFAVMQTTPSAAFEVQTASAQPTKR